MRTDIFEAAGFGLRVLLFCIFMTIVRIISFHAAFYNGFKLVQSILEVLYE